ncbi:hypothetical protein HGA91_05045 [candidate division WWE3 bacterium]|nr:hypothetical protein [candidate division WWE3 bacterium]
MRVRVSPPAPLKFMNTIIECIVATLIERTIRYRITPLDTTNTPQNPDDTVHQWLATQTIPGLNLQKAIVHSTSWRFENPNQIIITYLIYCDAITIEPNDSLEFEQFTAIEQTNPIIPRPANLKQQDVVIHAIRHLGFLIDQDKDGSVKSRLAPESLLQLGALRLRLAGGMHPAQL